MVAVYEGCFVFLRGENSYVSAIHSTSNEGNSSNIFELSSCCVGIGGKCNELIFEFKQSTDHIVCDSIDCVRAQAVTVPHNVVETVGAHKV